MEGVSFAGSDEEKGGGEEEGGSMLFLFLIFLFREEEEEELALVGEADDGPFGPFPAAAAAAVLLFARFPTDRDEFTGMDPIAMAYFCIRYRIPLMTPKVIKRRMSMPSRLEAFSIHQLRRVRPCFKEA